MIREESARKIELLSENIGSLCCNYYKSELSVGESNAQAGAEVMSTLCNVLAVFLSTFSDDNEETIKIGIECMNNNVTLALDRIKEKNGKATDAGRKGVGPRRHERPFNEND